MTAEPRGIARRPSAAAPIDPRRYRKLRRFLIAVLVRAFWWEVVLNRPLLRRFRRPAIARWVEVARRYRSLAIEMGGVLIKLGQFLSARVDVLPREITRVLAELQDEVPPAPFDEIARSIEEDLGRPLREAFTSVSPQAVGAASLAQVHRATLPGGGGAVVKVLRPGIEVLVETDLAALAVAARWLRWSRAIRRRVDLRRLLREFTQTTRRELDLAAEGRSAERFADNFADDPQVEAPAIDWERSGGRTLTMEDVSFVKISDFERLEAEGFCRAELAEKLYSVYMEQIFVHNFVHADPHPGNIFVRALEADAVEGEGEPASRGRPFRLVFVDFGMMAEVPERLREALSEYVIALGTKDSSRMVQAYRDAGVLLPTADTRRLEEIHDDLFDRLWGVRMGEMREAAIKEARYFLREYWDVISEIPFQMQTELLFVGRAFGLLSGLATSLDPEFDPWSATIPFARRLASGELGGRRGVFEGLLEQGRLALRLPSRADRFLTSAQRGELTLRASLAPDVELELRRLQRSLRRLIWTVLAAALLVSGVIGVVNLPETAWGWVGVGLGGAAFLRSLVPRP